jgi:hypothetical protein
MRMEERVILSERPEDIKKAENGFRSKWSGA